MTGVVDTSTAPHYAWGSLCEGWRLLNQPDLTVIEERMPPATSEARHLHNRATQLFYILDGELTFQMPDATEIVSKGKAFVVSPTDVHQVRNDGAADARFLVVSSPSTMNDREPA